MVRLPALKPACSSAMNTADRLHKHAHGVGGGVTEERGVVPLSLAQTARAHIALPGLGTLSTELTF